MVSRVDLSGRRYGRLLVLEEGETYVSPAGHTNRTWVCRCDCGEVKTVAHGSLVCKTRSCGCISKERLSKLRTKHKMTRTRPYDIWLNLKQRCNNDNSVSYPNYGGRGIGYDQRWEEFEVFWEEMGDSYSDGLSLERIDLDGNYCKDNCRWATDTEQARNKRKMLNNSSGVTGVSIKKYNGFEYWIASWRNLEGKRKSKAFSILKLGWDKAFEMACEYREKIINELNEKGAGYSEKHGK